MCFYGYNTTLTVNKVTVKLQNRNPAYTNENWQKKSSGMNRFYSEIHHSVFVCQLIRQAIPIFITHVFDSLFDNETFEIYFFHVYS